MQPTELCYIRPASVRRTACSNAILWQAHEGQRHPATQRHGIPATLSQSSNIRDTLAIASAARVLVKDHMQVLHLVQILLFCSLPYQRAKARHLQLRLGRVDVLLHEGLHPSEVFRCARRWPKPGSGSAACANDPDLVPPLSLYYFHTRCSAHWYPGCYLSACACAPCHVAPGWLQHQKLKFLGATCCLEHQPWGITPAASVSNTADAHTRQAGETHCTCRG